MDRYEGPAFFDWWANRHTNLCGEPVEVVITALDGGRWEAHGRFAALTDDGRDGVDFLRGMDPLFTLRFPDGSTVDVVLSGLAEDDTFMLTEAEVGGLSRVDAQ